MILVDTSVWVDHLLSPDAKLRLALETGDVATHPFVIGELACGNLRNRHELLSLWSDLSTAPVATDSEALEFIERNKLMGLGLGYIDVHLLAATALSAGARLWTRDKQLAVAAAKLNVIYTE
jgi:predicted nucleic acid-binding protein